MKTQIRKSVFETNSSSVHTIVVKRNGKYNFELERDSDNPNIVVGRCHDYCEMGKKYPEYLTTQQEKFEYLLTWIVCESEYKYDSVKESYLYGYLLNALRNVDSAISDIMIMDESKAYFDHETSPHSLKDCVVDIYNEQAITEFIFNDNIELKMDMD